MAADDGAEVPAVTEWLKYVPHGELLFHLAQGWVVSDDLHGTPHGAYAVLCVWVGEGEPT